ncbi:MAG: hypothetical protein AAF526_03435 [Pseudomonadota bacterium]
MPMTAAAAVSGCVMLGLTPLPGHVQDISVPADLTNVDLSTSVLDLLRASGVNDCSSDHSLCTFNGLRGVDVTSVDLSASVILINHYSKYDQNRIGIGVKIERVSEDVLRVTARGIGPYYTEAPTEEAADVIAGIISIGLNEGSG